MNVRVGVLGLAMLGSGCGGDTEPEQVEISLEVVEPAFATIDYDSDWVELGPGVSVQLVASLETEVEQSAVVFARGEELEPEPDSGTLTLRGTLTVELFADVDAGGQVFMGSVGTSTVTVETELASYDPFLIMEAIVPLLNTPAPGDITFTKGPLTYRVQNGFRFLPTLEGVCVGADSETDSMQYVNKLAWDVEYGPAVWVGVETPLGAPSKLAEAGLTFSAEVTPPRVFDLGTYSLSDGSEVSGVGPCGEVVDGELVK